MKQFARTCLLAAAVFACMPDGVSAWPATGARNYLPSNSSEPLDSFVTSGYKRADKVPLRILPLGASIMSGVGSSTHNG